MTLRCHRHTIESHLHTGPRPEIHGWLSIGSRVLHIDAVGIHVVESLRSSSAPI